MDIRSFKLRACRVFRANHPGESIATEWLEAKPVTWADGSSGFTGRFVARAEGFRTKVMTATLCGGAIMVR